MRAKMEATNIHHRILTGSTDGLPEKRSKVIRIFVSSTFTDMQQERNKLMTDAYPKLKQYCKQKHGCEFQVVDMRWGVQNTAAEDHSTSALCMNQIQACQRESAGPNFVCFLGDRYGSKFCQPKISSHHWTIINEHVSLEDEKQLLCKWYAVDMNDIDQARILLPLNEETGKNRETWNTDNVKLMEIIKKSSTAAHEQGKLTDDEWRKFVYSVTEEEVENGILNYPGANKRCLAFFRKLEDINQSHDRAWRFIDKVDGVVNAEAQSQLANLKDRIRVKLPSAQIKEYTVQWSNSGGMDSSDHAEYLTKFNDNFVLQMERLIDERIEETLQSPEVKAVDSSPLVQEVLYHSRLCVDKCSQLVPRDDILSQIQNYITCDTTKQVLVVQGLSGVGKTSIMAQAIQNARVWLSQKQMTLVFRFLGTSPQSSTAQSLLYGLCSQLECILPLDSKITTSSGFNEMITQFNSYLARWPIDQHLIIVLDSVDQLKASDDAFKLRWLPTELKTNVKFVISTLPELIPVGPDGQQALTFAECAEKRGITASIKVENLTIEKGWEILNKWLQTARRQLNAEQKEQLNVAIKDARPIYLKLVFAIVSSWRSFQSNDVVEEREHIPGDIKSCIEELFSRLEKKHGSFEVKRSLAYLTACPNGISEVELEDVLSLDDEFLNSVYKYHVPPVRRVPPMILARIRQDISDYIMEKDSDGVAVLSWYHRQFIEGASRIFIEPIDMKPHFKILDDYFSGVWYNKMKPFEYSQHMVTKLRLAQAESEAIRYVPAQPTAYQRNSFNPRKIHVLSALWVQDEVHTEAEDIIRRYAFDLEFLLGKLTLDSWPVIAAEMERISKLDGAPEHLIVNMRYLYGSLKMHHSTLTSMPDTACGHLHAILELLYMQLHEDVDEITPLLEQVISGKGLLHSALVPTRTMMSFPGTALNVSQKHPLDPYCVRIFEHDQQVLVVTASSSVIVTELSTMNILMNLPAMTGFLGNWNTRITMEIIKQKDDVLIMCARYGILLVISLDTQEVIKRIFSTKIGTDKICPLVNPTIQGIGGLYAVCMDEDSCCIVSFESGKIIWRLQGVIHTCMVRDVPGSQDRVELTVLHTGVSDRYIIQFTDTRLKISNVSSIPMEVCMTMHTQDTFRALRDDQDRLDTEAIIKFRQFLLITKKQTEDANSTHKVFSCKNTLKVKTIGKLNSGREIAVLSSEAYNSQNLSGGELQIFDVSHVQLLARLPCISVEQADLITERNQLLITSGRDIKVFQIYEKNDIISLKRLAAFTAALEDRFHFIKGLPHNTGYVITGSTDNQVRFWNLDKILGKDTKLSYASQPYRINMGMTMSPRGHLAFSALADRHAPHICPVFDGASGLYLTSLPRTDTNKTDTLDQSCWLAGSDTNVQYLACLYMTWVIYKVTCRDNQIEIEAESERLVPAPGDELQLRRTRTNSSKHKFITLMSYQDNEKSLVVVYDVRNPGKFLGPTELLFDGKKQVEWDMAVKNQHMTDDLFIIHMFKDDDFFLFLYKIGDDGSFTQVHKTKLDDEIMDYGCNTYHYLVSANCLLVQRGNIITVTDCNTFKDTVYKDTLSTCVFTNILASPADEPVLYIEMARSEDRRDLVRIDFKDIQQWRDNSGYEVLMSDVPVGIKFVMSPDCKYLVLSCEDRVDQRLRLIRMKDMKEIAAVMPPAPKWARRCDFTGDSKYLCCNLVPGEFVSWLIVDPDDPNQQNTVDTLPCRKRNRPTYQTLPVDSVYAVMQQFSKELEVAPSLVVNSRIAPYPDSTEDLITLEDQTVTPLIGAPADEKQIIYNLSRSENEKSKWKPLDEEEDDDDDVLDLQEVEVGNSQITQKDNSEESVSSEATVNPRSEIKPASSHVKSINPLEKIAAPEEKSPATEEKPSASEVQPPATEENLTAYEEQPPVPEEKLTVSEMQPPATEAKLTVSEEKPPEQLATSLEDVLGTEDKIYKDNSVDLLLVEGPNRASAKKSDSTAKLDKNDAERRAKLLQRKNITQLISDVPTEERSKRLDRAHDNIGKKYTATCSLQ